MKHNLDTMAEKLIQSVEIGYYLAMDSFKNEAKKRDFSEYYYKILDTLVTPPYSPAQTQKEGENEESREGE